MSKMLDTRSPLSCSMRLPPQTWCTQGNIEAIYGRTHTMATLVVTAILIIVALGIIVVQHRS